MSYCQNIDTVFQKDAGDMNDSHLWFRRKIYISLFVNLEFLIIKYFCLYGWINCGCFTMMPKIVELVFKSSFIILINISLVGNIFRTDSLWRKQRPTGQFLASSVNRDNSPNEKYESSFKSRLGCRGVVTGTHSIGRGHKSAKGEQK